MFKNIYQGGAVVEIFSAQGKDPVAKWKLHGGPSAIRKEYHKEVKGFVYCLEGSSQTVKMQMPEDGKMALGLLQRFLVLQVNVPQCKDFSIELVITDSGHLKRRLYLSTVHKELFATPLHARIPFVGLKRNIWSNLCIDLASFTGELFKGTGFLTLDGITLSASCKLRRIFTMKAEPTGMSADGMFLSGAGVMDLIPRSCQFLPDVYHVTQVLNMKKMQQADMRAGLVNSDCAPDQSATVTSASFRKTRPQGFSHTAFGSRVSGPPPQTGRKNSGPSEGMDGSAVRTLNTGPNSSARTIQKGTIESQSTVDPIEKSSHGEPCHTLHEGKFGFELIAHPDAVPGGHRNRSGNGEMSTPPSSRRESSGQPLTLTEKKRGHQTAGPMDKDESLCYSPAEESASATLTAAESLSCWSWPGCSSDLQVRSSLGESNGGSEPQLILGEEVFTFSSLPHSARRGQGHGDQEKVETRDNQVQRKRGRHNGAQPEDDFIGSESEEDKIYTQFPHQRASVDSSPASPRSPDPALDVHLKVQPGSHSTDQTSAKELSPNITNMHPHSPSSRRAEPAGMVPKRCLSPSGSRQGHKFGSCGPGVASQALDEDSSAPFCRRFLQEVTLEDSRQHKDNEDERQKLVDSSSCDLHLLSSLQMQGDDDEELRMLASLKREQEEDECGASGLSVSQIHQCNVSISMNSDDTSTWTHIPMPTNQGHHYQKEMNPLQHSNPREWMDVLSPPIIPPSQRRRSGSTWHHHKDLIRGGDVSVHEEENEDEYLNLLYDPCLNCYFDPQTGKYYELA
ncbi:protein CFAP20DC [Centroberyx affinis]|uniref:protein CFAP20DC n=1 Tax=Centroberyx affinis TaxID=166261 RepID=UPI003A5BD723